MPLVLIAADDPRCQVTAFVTDQADRHLYEVVDDRRGVLVLEDARTGRRQTISRAAISTYKLARRALTCPDTPINSD